MWTLFDEELDRTARRIRDNQWDFDAGRTGPAELARYSAKFFAETVRYARENSPFYRDHLARVDPDGIQDLTADELARIPFTTKQDLRAAMFDIVSGPLGDSRIFYETTGTTGRSTPCPRSAVDMLHNDMVLTSYYGTVFRPLGSGQIVGVSGPTELHAFGDTFGDVCHNLGLAVAKMWPHSPMVGFPRAIEVMRTLPLTGLFCTPGMALSLAKRAVAEGLDPGRDFALKVIMLTGELASPSLVRRIGEIWGATAHNALYASQEASVLGAVCADGRMYTAPMNNYYEVIDPDSGEAAPVRDGGRAGELVVTNLYQGSKPLVRYRTGDLVRITDPTAAGVVPAPTIEVLGRVQDEIALNGHRITGYELEDLLLRHVRGVLDFQIVIDHEDGADTLALEVHAAPGRDGAPDAVEATRAAVRERLGTHLEVRATELGAITGTGAMVSWKAARIVDRREATSAEKAAAAALSAARSS
jgi:phenylacetate-CoA ligase